MGADPASAGAVLPLSPEDTAAQTQILLDHCEVCSFHDAFYSLSLYSSNGDRIKGNDV